MTYTLQEIQRQSGAIFLENQSIPLTFGNNELAISTIENGCIVCDRSHWGLISLRGQDKIRFLHNQTTNNIEGLKPSRGCDTIFVNSTGRTLDLATAYVTEEEILVLVSPNRRTFLMEWMDRYLFPMDKVELKDISDEKAIFSLIGSKSSEIIKNLEINDLNLQNYGDHQTILIEGIPVKIALGSGLHSFGYTFIIDSDQAVNLWAKFMNLGVIPAGEQVWEYLRIHQGRPYPDAELTEDYIALEAGLWKAISFNKGCYIGQETIARLNTYKGVKQRLFGLKLNQFVEPKTPIMLEDVKIGMLTSCLDNFGLGYIRTKAGGEGLKVNIGEATAEVVSVPFLSHDYYS